MFSHQMNSSENYFCNYSRWLFSSYFKSRIVISTKTCSFAKPAATQRSLQTLKPFELNQCNIPPLSAACRKIYKLFALFQRELARSQKWPIEHKRKQYDHSLQNTSKPDLHRR